MLCLYWNTYNVHLSFIWRFHVHFSFLSRSCYFCPSCNTTTSDTFSYVHHWSIALDLPLQNHVRLISHSGDFTYYRFGIISEKEDFAVRILPIPSRLDPFTSDLWPQSQNSIHIQHSLKGHICIYGTVRNYLLVLANYH